MYNNIETNFIGYNTEMVISVHENKACNIQFPHGGTVYLYVTLQNNCRRINPDVTSHCSSWLYWRFLIFLSQQKDINFNCQFFRFNFSLTSNNTGFMRSEEHTSELQSRETISYAVFCLKKKKDIHGHKDRT